MFSIWEWSLILVVSVQATFMAYMKQPRWKAFILTVPVPFCFAVMAVGRPVDASNIIALFLLYVFTASTRILYYNAKIPIIAAIVMSALLYVALGTLIAPVVPTGNTAFLATAAAAFVFAIILIRRVKPRSEAQHRSPLPIYVKLPLIIAIVTGLVCAKSLLQGFITAFPMVGLVGAYEARKSLYTISDQIPTLIVVLLPMMIVSHFTSPSLGLGGSLLLGWAACAGALVLEWRASMVETLREQAPDAAR